MLRIYARLAAINRYLTALIALAIIQGIALCICSLSTEELLESLCCGNVSLPVAFGLVAMMYPTMCAIRYESLAPLLRSIRRIWPVFVSHWFASPLIMFSLAVLFFRQQPEYMTGIILIGLARGIGGAATWNKLAEGDADLASGLAALNAVLQLLFYPVYAWLFVAVLPRTIGVAGSGPEATVSQFAICVALYLGIPLLAGVVTRAILISVAGSEWYELFFMRRLLPLRSVSVLLTIVLILSLKAEEALAFSELFLLIAVPLTLFCVTMFAVAFYWSYARGDSYEHAATTSLSSASNNIELAIAIAFAVYGVDSAEAFTTVVAPFVEAPAMIALVTTAWYLNRKLFAPEQGAHRLPPNLANIGKSKLSSNAA
ncbi:arsenic resistance protein [Lacipirellula sp.]|uniref:arsenic resistance protein n=1 Tax=Lacipirellula sp. TaxID=2691419 RepID=UPI003D0D324A